ncbi:MAG: IS630 family transposase [Candidatus Competibacteraceae bacterium]
MSSLDNIIDLPANLEVKRALAVKMILFDFKTEDICALLNVSDAFVSKWKIRFENEGASALKLNYKGGKGFLTEDQRDEIIFYLRMQPHYSVKKLRDYIEYHYGVVYHSKQSYYDLLHEARLSWHKTQAANPKRDEAHVLQKREEIKKRLEARQAEIVSGEVVVFVEDEGHLLWGDTLGYGWGRRNERTEIPMINVKQRQTYYGVMNLYNQEFMVTPAECGNGENTVAFLNYLQELNPDKKLIIIWDKARYHCGNAVQAYLNTVNQGLEEKDWKVTCLLFAPNAPDQNPVEDVWLQGKNFLRRHFYENKTFQQVKQSFLNFLNNKIFNFEKPKWYL